MTLAAGVPPDNVAAVTDLGDATYQHDDHHRDLAAVCDAYLEFLADAQTPYFMQVQNGTGNYFTGIHKTDYIAEASQWLTAPLPAQPLPALADPFVGPGIVTNPIGFNPSIPYYTGPGAFRALKTGVISVQWSLITADATGVEGSNVSMFFHGEDGTNQNYAAGSTNPSTGGAVGPGNTAVRTRFDGFSLLTIADFDDLDDNPYSTQFPSYPSPAYPNQYAIDAGMMPLGWDIYPWWTIQNHAVDLTGLTIDHLTVLIRKIA